MHSIIKGRAASSGAVLLGFSSSCQFKNHEENNNKGFSLQKQLDKFYVLVQGKGQGRAVKMQSQDAFYVALMVMKVLKNQFHGIDSIDILASLSILKSQ